VRALFKHLLDAFGLVSRTQDLKREDRTRHWYNVRGWINRPDYEGLRFSWQACGDPRLAGGIKFAVGGEREVYGHLELFGFSFYWGFEGLNLQFDDERELYVRFHDGLLAWTVWKSPHGRSRADGWRNETWNVDDFIRGRRQYTSELVERRDVKIPMPEGSYPAVVELRRDTWSRARWPSETIVRAHIEIPNGVPMPGKGENSWDCDDDATFAMTTPARTVEDGVAAVVGGVLRDRWRRSHTHGWDKAPNAEAAE
jgi:hypothetical protein